MTTLIYLPIARLFISLSLLAALTMTATAQDSYEKTIQTWRADREAKLKADDGWLTERPGIYAGAGHVGPGQAFHHLPRSDQQ
jgi:hypothetical protein